MTIDFIEFCDLFASFALGESLNTKTAASECCLGRFCTFSRPGTCFAQILSTGNLADFRKCPWKFNRPPWISISRNQPTKSRISIERPTRAVPGPRVLLGLGKQVASGREHFIRAHKRDRLAGKLAGVASHNQQIRVSNCPTEYGKMQLRCRRDGGVSRLIRTRSTQGIQWGNRRKVPGPMVGIDAAFGPPLSTTDYS